MKFLDLFRAVPVWIDTLNRRYVGVLVGGATTKVEGVFASYPLDAPAVDLVPATHVTSFITGVDIKGFLMENLDVISAGEAVLIGWSSTTNDQATVATNLNAFATLIGTPDGTGVSDVIAISNHSKEIPPTFWDEITSMKTIGVRMSGGTAIDVVARVVS